jgi:hypothetical protein
VSEDKSGMTMPEWVKHCADMRQSTSLSARSKQALTLNVADFFHHEVWVPFHPAQGSGPSGQDLPATTFLSAPASTAMLHLTWAGELAFATSDSLAPTARFFGYTGGLITCAQRSAMSQADVVMRDLFIRLSQGATTSNPEEDAIEITEGWRNSQWPDCMITLPKTGPASTVDLKRMFEYAANNCWRTFKAKAVAAASSKQEPRALFPKEKNPANVEATLLQLAPSAKAAVTLPPHSILEAVGRLAALHMGWLQRSDVSTWTTDAIAAAIAGAAARSGTGHQPARSSARERRRQQTERCRLWRQRRHRAQHATEVDGVCC